MKSIMNIKDSEINSDLEKIGPVYDGMFYIIHTDNANPYNILYLTEQK